MTTDLFGYTKTNNSITLENAGKISGLEIYFDFINAAEERQLMAEIDKSDWLSDLKRRVQHYGYKYDYKARRIDENFYIGNIPEWMSMLSNRLQEKSILDFNPDQAIINEYVDDQGIAAHIDCEPCFGDTIISISLAGHCVMNFQKNLTVKQEEKIPLFLPQKTLVVMRGESRFDWYHGIPARKSDKFNGGTHKRQRRVSITFRKVIVPNK